jgi:hypothetical protein
MLVREIIQFQPNIPVRLKLKFDSTKPCKSKFNDEDQYMLTTTDGRIAFLTPCANARLEAAGVKRGDEISITQTMLVKAQRKSIDWMIGNVEENAIERSAATVAPVCRADGTRKSRAEDSLLFLIFRSGIVFSSHDLIQNVGPKIHGC